MDEGEGGEGYEDEEEEEAEEEDQDLDDEDDEDPVSSGHPGLQFTNSTCMTWKSLYQPA